MFEAEFGRVQTDSRRRRPAIKRIAEDGQAFLRGVDPDLMGAACEGFSDHGGDGNIQQPTSNSQRRSRIQIPIFGREHAVWILYLGSSLDVGCWMLDVLPGINDLEPRLRDISPGMHRPANIPFSRADKAAPDRKFLLVDFPIRQQHIPLTNTAFRELLGQRAIGAGSLRENNYARGFFIQSMNDRQGCPARLAVSQPIVQALARKRTGCVRVDARRFVHDQQVIILKNYARQHVQMEPQKVSLLNPESAGGSTLETGRDVSKWPKVGTV